ncbi:MAG: hypothetical protein HFE80_02190 [Clostridiaceae bacterium]|jgi:hypothetical protein|nr:hypothetical protein [Clostridiaceae bacterium]
MDERIMATMEQILQEMRRNRALLEQMEETQQDQARLLQEHRRLLQEQGEDLLKIKVRLENDIGPKLDMLFEGHVNLAEQRDRDQREMRRRMRDVEDRNTILTAQVEGLLKAQ